MRMTLAARTVAQMKGLEYGPKVLLLPSLAG